MVPTAIKSAFIAGQSSLFEYGAVGWSASPYITFFKKQGTRFIKLTDPATMPTAAVTNITWSRFGNYVAVRFGTNTIALYVIAGGTVTFVRQADFTSSAASYGGDLRYLIWTKESSSPTSTNWLSLVFPSHHYYNIESKLASPASTVSNDYGASGFSDLVGAAFLLNYNSADGGAVFANGTGAAYLFCVELGGIGSSILSGRIVTQPVTAPVYLASRIDGTAFAVALNAASSNVLIYTRSGAGWDIAHTLTVGGTPVRCEFSPDGNYLTVVHDTTPFYDVIDLTGTPAVVAATDALPAAGTDVAMSRDGQTFITGSGTTPFLQLQVRNGAGNYVTLEAIDFDGVTESAVTAVGIKNNEFIS